MNRITLIPAYGRDYKSAKAVKADWETGKDFIVSDFLNPYDGKPANKQDLAGYTVTIRYSKLTKLTVIKNQGEHRENISQGSKRRSD